MLEEIKKNVSDVEFVNWADEEKINLLKQNVECIKEAISDVNSNVKKNFIKIGYYLWCIKRGDLFSLAHKPGEQYVTYYLFHTDSFTNFVHDYFGFSKTTTNNLVAIMERFAPMGLDGKVMEKYEPYSYSQLVEMLPLTDEELDQVKPEMSIREIRELKKTLSDIDPKPLPFKEKKPSEVSSSEGSSQKIVFDLKVKKDEFRSHCKNFFEKFNYELKLGERKQGGFAFAGSFFNYLEEKGFFNV